MSLVAYAASSDDDSENEMELEQQTATTKGVEMNVNGTNGKIETAAIIGHISDEDDDFMPQEISLLDIKPPPKCRLVLSLPKPIVSTKEAPEKCGAEPVEEQVARAFAKLPMPKTKTIPVAIIEEEDDEFLHKKVPAALEKPLPPPIKGRVKISIPSLRDFADVDKEKAEKQLLDRSAQVKPDKGSGLLSILPQAKSERVFTKKPQTDPNAAPVAKPAFVPDTVKQRRAAHNTEGVDGFGPKANPGKTTKTSKATTPLASVSESEDEDDEDNAGDFFSLNSEQKLPEVSSNELNALVAKRAAKMMEASNKFLAEAPKMDVDEPAPQQGDEIRLAQKRYQDQQLNTEAMDALVGKNAKRRRKEEQDMQVIDISGSQVLPDREEWMRTALASATTFQATGVLTDEEPIVGTRRKHQITYLAHKAKANEAELQAMWSANRQTRRATQSKYGF